MPRDGSRTRDLLVTAAERLFAEHGIWRTTSREIVEQAGQRNTSALTYHFGSREGLLREILTRHGAPIDHERGVVFAELADPSTRGIVNALARPMAAELETADGRCYLRIVHQLTGLLDLMTDHENEFITGNLAVLLDQLERAGDRLPASVRQERIQAMILLMSASLAERARRIERGADDFDRELYVTNLIDMLTGVLEAPSQVEAAAPTPTSG